MYLSNKGDLGFLGPLTRILPSSILRGGRHPGARPHYYLTCPARYWRVRSALGRPPRHRRSRPRPAAKPVATPRRTYRPSARLSRPLPRTLCQRGHRPPPRRFRFTPATSNLPLTRSLAVRVSISRIPPCLLSGART